MEDYRSIADALAADIAAGRLRPGDRLPPQRAFARRRGIAGSTAARVYRELGRRGLVTGEVGRGTFVRAGDRPPGPALVEPGAARVDLELNYPVVEGQAALLAGALGGLLRPDVLTSALLPAGPSGTPEAREATARLIARGGWEPGPARLLFAGNGRQAVAGAVAALVPAGGRLGVDALTYPMIKVIAGRLGVTLVPIAADEDGMRPDALAAAHRRAPLRAVYLQTTLHNPLGLTMPPARRADLAATLRDLGLHAVEDAIWAFLREDAEPPLAALAPERTVLADSLSKRLAPGLTIGFALAPAELSAPVAAALRSGAWTATGFALSAAARWIADGTVAEVERAKRRDAALRQRVAARHLAGFAVRTDPHAYFCWWELPPPWRAETFVAAAARRGIAVTPAASFAVSARSAPAAVRLGLASPPVDVLSEALAALAALARRTPEDAADE
ncbi:GntR family transcriptional regulator [Sphaerisporangium siamense]|uniref:DNA-binding transcriptional MocR family regulator n=1 Tax=Sphaerisporangium siamense TaxID=795645 RepID=A0A7W7GCA1_9ACTN|nr:PLP-dependent aminotransferase family protein [Sphaerisporangium siamense]MBB4703675.1 DNA-binding transcriptional MocR family regulator [Sphaerisporangium siamense]GII82147.1 GntR family transcriptional regulator [Sphaerisporangium siamense]